LSDRTGSWCQLQPVAMDRGRVCSSVFAGLSRSIGALGERVGRKWIFLAGLVVFVLGAGSGLRSPDKARLEPQTCPAVAATHTDPSDNPSEVAPVESFSGHPNRKATGCLLVACNRRCCMVSARPTAPGGKGLLGFWASGAVYTRPRSAGRLPRPVPTCTPKEYAGGGKGSSNRCGTSSPSKVWNSLQSTVWNSSHPTVCSVDVSRVLNGDPLPSPSLVHLEFHFNSPFVHGQFTFLVGFSFPSCELSTLLPRHPTCCSWRWQVALNSHPERRLRPYPIRQGGGTSQGGPPTFPGTPSSIHSCSLISVSSVEHRIPFAVLAGNAGNSWARRTDDVELFGSVSPAKVQRPARPS